MRSHRRAWLFADTQAGARANATAYSLIETARAYDLNVYEYIKYILTRMPALDYNNYLFAHDGEADEVLIDGALAELKTVMAAFRQAGVTAIFVTNELGCGIVPMEHVSRLYRDLIGKINQAAAAEADEVYLSVCGITTELKQRAVRLPEVKR